MALARPDEGCSHQGMTLGQVISGAPGWLSLVILVLILFHRPLSLLLTQAALRLCSDRDAVGSWAIRHAEQDRLFDLIRDLFKRREPSSPPRTAGQSATSHEVEQPVEGEP